jgi:asparagine synthase (glutamine-hydrolysing)
LSVAILGRAQRLLTSFDARPADRLVAAIDLRGRYREPFSNWEAAIEVPSARLRADLSEWLPHNLLHKVDGASMAFSLEARVPYLALPVVRFVAALPDELKVRGRETKRVLRRALAGVVPDAILSRPKQGFDLPLAAWLRGPLKDLAIARLDERSLARWPGLIAKEAAALLSCHLSGEQDFGLPLFNLLSVSLFLEQHAL